MAAESRQRPLRRRSRHGARLAAAAAACALVAWPVGSAFARGRPGVARSAAPAASAGLDTAPSVGSAAGGEILTYDEERRAAARSALLQAIEPLERGFRASEQERADVSELIATLSELSPTPDPTSRLGGNWTLIYTDAPDITGIPSGPMSELARIGQEIDSVAGTIANVIEYRPSQLARSLPFGDLAGQDKLVQRVFTDYKPASSTEVELNIKGFGFFPERVFGFGVPDFVRLKQEGPLSLPFGRFEILYLDEDIRIVKTGQGWTSINRLYDPAMDS